MQQKQLNLEQFQRKHVENIFSNCVGPKVTDVLDAIMISIIIIVSVVYINANHVNIKYL